MFIIQTKNFILFNQTFVCVPAGSNFLIGLYKVLQHRIHDFVIHL